MEKRSSHDLSEVGKYLNANEHAYVESRVSHFLSCVHFNHCLSFNSVHLTEETALIFGCKKI